MFEWLLTSRRARRELATALGYDEGVGPPGWAELLREVRFLWASFMACKCIHREQQQDRGRREGLE